MTIIMICQNYTLFLVLYSLFFVPTPSFTFPSQLTRYITSFRRKVTFPTLYSRWDGYTFQIVGQGKIGELVSERIYEITLYPINTAHCVQWVGLYRKHVNFSHKVNKEEKRIKGIYVRETYISNIQDLRILFKITVNVFQSNKVNISTHTIPYKQIAPKSRNII